MVEYPVYRLLLLWLGIIFVTVFLSLLPFIVQRLRPRGQGLWKILGELWTPKKAFAYILGSLIGLFLLAIFFYGRDVTNGDLQSLWLLALTLLIIFLAVTISIRLYRIEKHNKM